MRTSICVRLLCLRAMCLAVQLEAAVRPPLTLIGGFLGAGKTTTLTHLLTNRDALRIAVLVNDVAAVNVDAMSLRREMVQLNGIEMVQLENGCVCCSAAGDLVPAVTALLERDGLPFDHIVIELSGVADPVNVENSLGLGGIAVDRKVALVDANSFPAIFVSNENAGAREDLTGHAHDGEAEEHTCVIDQPVVQLLLRQVETSDVILANKCDLASEDELRTTLRACRILNEEAAIVSTTFGDAALWDVLPARVAAAATAATDARSPSEEHTLLLNGVNCGGCGDAVKRALIDAGIGVTTVLAKSKADTGGHPNTLTVTGSCTERAVRDAIAALDAGRGKYDRRARRSARRVHGARLFAPARQGT